MISHSPECCLHPMLDSCSKSKHHPPWLQQAYSGKFCFILWGSCFGTSSATHGKFPVSNLNWAKKWHVWDNSKRWPPGNTQLLLLIKSSTRACCYPLCIFVEDLTVFSSFFLPHYTTRLKQELFDWDRPMVGTVVISRNDEHSLFSHSDPGGWTFSWGMSCFKFIFA